MKEGDLVKSKYAPTPMGVIIETGDGLSGNIVVVTIVSQDGSIICDQNPEFYEVINEAS